MKATPVQAKANSIVCSDRISLLQIIKLRLRFRLSTTLSSRHSLCASEWVSVCLFETHSLSPIRSITIKCWYFALFLSSCAQNYTDVQMLLLCDECIKNYMLFGVYTFQLHVIIFYGRQQHFHAATSISLMPTYAHEICSDRQNAWHNKTDSSSDYVCSVCYQHQRTFPSSPSQSPLDFVFVK